MNALLLIGLTLTQTPDPPPIRVTVVRWVAVPDPPRVIPQPMPGPGPVWFAAPGRAVQAVKPTCYVDPRTGRTVCPYSLPRK